MKAEAVGETDVGGDEKLTFKFVWPYRLSLTLELYRVHTLCWLYLCAWAQSTCSGTGAHGQKAGAQL